MTYFNQAFLCRGINISVLRHEAEFYGITPLGGCWSYKVVRDFRELHSSTNKVSFWLHIRLGSVGTFYC